MHVNVRVCCICMCCVCMCTYKLCLYVLCILECVASLHVYTYGCLCVSIVECIYVAAWLRRSIGSRGPSTIYDGAFLTNCDRIRQNFQGGKLLRLCTKHTIHWKTFAVHQVHAINYVLYTANDSRGKLLRLARKPRKFSPSKVLPYTVYQTFHHQNFLYLYLKQSLLHNM